MNKLTRLMMASTLTLASTLALAEATFPTVMVYKTPDCGCCTEWAKHMEENGFNIMNHMVDDTAPAREKANLPMELTSCHTAFIGDYVVEGHVPAEDVKRMLTEKPAIRGIAVPGMPMGSPGMEYGDHKQPYQTISYTVDGRTAVFASH